MDERKPISARAIEIRGQRLGVAAGTSDSRWQGDEAKAARRDLFVLKEYFGDLRLVPRNQDTTQKLGSTTTPVRAVAAVVCRLFQPRRVSVSRMGDRPASASRPAMKNALPHLSRTKVFWLITGSLLLFSLALRYLLLDKTNINWDEFFFLHNVHRSAAGEHTSLVLTAHGHVLSWILLFPGNEVDHIIVARHAMFILAVVSSMLLAWLGFRLIGGTAGVFAAFASSSFAYVLRHGTSFRYDSLIVPCYLGAAVALVSTRRPRTTAALAGALAALGLFFSIKALFFVPSLLAVAVLPALTERGELRPSVMRTAVFAATATGVAVVLFGLHWLSLADAPPAVPSTITAIAQKVIDFYHTLPQGVFLLQSLQWDTPTWALLFLGLVLLGGDLVHRPRDKEQVKRLQLLALAAPLVTIYFYRNSFPYYYTSILPTACLFAGYLWRRVERSQARPLVVAGLVLACAYPVAARAWPWFAHNNTDQIAVQRDVVDAVYEVFPEPVAYIDRCGMIASYEKVGPFMSTWGMENYRQAGTDIIPPLLRAHEPKLVIANSPALQLHIPLRHVSPGYRWRPNDFHALQQNFIHHWGPLWVAGKTIAAEPGTEARFEILISGPYTVEARTPVTIDGITLSPGDPIELAQGTHALSLIATTSETVRLRWGERLARPQRAPIRAAVFHSFDLGRPPR
jgi:hypothetical protein